MPIDLGTRLGGILKFLAFPNCLGKQDMGHPPHPQLIFQIV
jgi:hypothetical protein